MHATQQNKECEHTGIASNGMGDVAFCAECNIVHLSLQYMTLRLSPAAFRALVQLVASAQSRFDAAWAGSQAAGVTPDAVPAPQVH